MSPRPRNPLNDRLPPGLSLHATGQYRYVHPVSKKHHYLGTNRDEAARAAQKLNALLLPSDPLVDKVVRLEHKVSECVALFRREGIPARQWKPKTLENYRSRLNRIEADLGHRAVEDLTVKDCAEYLRSVTEGLRARQQFRTVLIFVLEHAVQEGWMANNVARLTKTPKPRRQRNRLTLDAYRAVWQKAEPWLQNAMDLSLHTLLRRSDIAAMRFEDIRDGCLYVIPHKTETSTYVRMKMKLEGQLLRIIERCKDGRLSPYLVHRLPSRLPAHGKRAKEREHHLQLLPEDITRGFREALQAAGLKYTGPAPTFHEIRSLGGDLYRQAGWTLEQVQTLMGHASEAMTRHYLEGHDAPWIETPAGLNLSARNGSEMVGKR